MLYSLWQIAITFMPNKCIFHEYAKAILIPRKDGSYKE